MKNKTVNKQITKNIKNKKPTYNNNKYINKRLNNFKFNKSLNFKNNYSKRFDFRATKALEKKQEIKKKWMLKSIYFNRVNSLHNQNKNYIIKKNRYIYESPYIKHLNSPIFINRTIDDLRILELFNKNFALNLSKNLKLDRRYLKYFIKQYPQNIIHSTKFKGLLSIKKSNIVNRHLSKKFKAVKKNKTVLLKPKYKWHKLSTLSNIKNRLKVKKISTSIVVQPFKNNFNRLLKLRWFNKFIIEGSQLRWFKKHIAIKHRKNRYKSSKRWTKKNIYKGRIYSNDQCRIFRYIWYYNSRFVSIKRFSVFVYKAAQIKLKKKYNKFLFLSNKYKQKYIYRKYIKKLTKKINHTTKLKQQKNYIKILSKAKKLRNLVYQTINIRRSLSFKKSSQLTKLQNKSKRENKIVIKNNKPYFKLIAKKKLKYLNKFRTKKYRFIKRNKRYLFNYLKYKKIKRFYQHKKNIVLPRFKIFLFKKCNNKRKSKITIYNYTWWQVSRKLRYKLKWKRRLKKKKWNRNYYFKKMTNYHKQNRFKPKIFVKIPKKLKTFWAILVKPNSYFSDGILNKSALHALKILKWQSTEADKYQFIKNENITVDIKKYSAIKININTTSNLSFTQNLNYNLIKFNVKNKLWINSVANNKIIIVYSTINNVYYYLNAVLIGSIKFNIINSNKEFKTFLIKKYSFKSSKIINLKIPNIEYNKNSSIYFNNNKINFYKNKVKKIKINNKVNLLKKVTAHLNLLKKIWLSKTLFSIPKLNLNLQNNYVYKNQNINNLVKNAINELCYEENFYGQYDEFSFKWKFFTKKWFFNISRWKRAISFRWLMRKAWNNYRKLQKNFMFIKLFRTNFLLSTGLTEIELLNEWKHVRKGNSNNNLALEQFNKHLQLKMDGIVMLFGLSPNRLVAQELIRCGGVRVNGLVTTNFNKFVKINNIIQFDKFIIDNVKSLYSLIKWNSIKVRIKYVGFIQTIWSLMLFKFIRLPYKHELFEESILTERWLRFFIRYFPIKISKYKKAKIKWHKY